MTDRSSKSFVDKAFSDLAGELYEARIRFPKFNSPHEGIAVILEEYRELERHVFGDTGRSLEARSEAIQLAAMALRFVLDLSDLDE
jgi:hypothetical protein